MHTHLQTRHHSFPRCILGLFCGDMILFCGCTFICSQANTLDLCTNPYTYTIHIHTIVKQYGFTHTKCMYICIYMWIYIFGWGDSKMNVPAVWCRIPDDSSRKRRWRVRHTRHRSTARHVITPRQCTDSGRGGTGLFCRYTGLFWGDVGLVCSAL